VEVTGRVKKIKLASFLSQHVDAILWSGSSPGVNFTNGLRKAFTHADPKIAKNSVKLSVSYCAFRICACKSFAFIVDEIDPGNRDLRRHSNNTWQWRWTKCYFLAFWNSDFTTIVGKKSCYLEQCLPTGGPP